MLQRKTDTEKIETNDETQGEAEQINCNERKLFNNLNTDDSLSGGQHSNLNEIKSEPDETDTEGIKVITDEGVNKNDDSKDSKETIVGTEDACVDENAEGFIGPKLPPRMTKEEIDAFYKEMKAKFKLDEL